MDQSENCTSSTMFSLSIHSEILTNEPTWKQFTLYVHYGRLGSRSDVQLHLLLSSASTEFELTCLIPPYFGDVDYIYALIASPKGNNNCWCPNLCEKPYAYLPCIVTFCGAANLPRE